MAHERVAPSDRAVHVTPTRDGPAVERVAGVEPALEPEGPTVIDEALLRRLQATAGNAAVSELLRADRQRRGAAVVAQAAQAAPAPPAHDAETEAEAAEEGEQEQPGVAEHVRLAAAPPADPPPAPDAEPDPAVTVQREADDGDGGGLLGGIKRRIGQAVSGLRSGWDRLSGAASTAFAGITSRVSAGARALADLGSSVTSRVRSAFTSAGQTVTRLSDGLMSGLKRSLSGLAGAASGISSALASMDVAAIRGAWERLQGMMGAVSEGFARARAAMTERIGALFTGLQTGFNSALESARARAQALGDGLRSAATAVQQRLSSLWAGMQERAGRLNGVAGGVARFLMSIVERLLSAARSLWQSVQNGWSALERRASGLVDHVTKWLGDLWEGLKRRVAGLWDTLRAVWSRAVEAASRAANRLAGGVASMWHRIQGFSLKPMLDKLEQYVSFIGDVKEAAKDPKAAMAPYAARIAGELQAGMPAKARDVASEHLQGAGAGGQSAAPGPVVQRQPATATAGDGRSTLTLGNALSLIWGAIKEKWAKLNVGEVVLGALWTLVWPWPTVWAELKGMWSDWKAAAHSLYAPRSIAHPLEWLHDMWSMLLRLSDFPLILWRHLNNIGLALWGWVTIALTVIGAVGGTVAGTVIGAIAGFLAGFGVGAAPGAGAGAGGGGLAGAGAGFGAALAIGEVLVISYASAELSNLLKVILALWTARETPEEQARDASSAADSSLALAITLVLVLLGWIGSKIAAAAAPIFRALVPGWLRDAFAAFRKGMKGEPPPEEQKPPDQQQQPGQQPQQPPAPEPYDPKVRTDAELQTDLDPTPRPGETPEQAAQRAQLARQEIHLREQMAIYNALGEEPPRFNVAENDAANAGNGAHTLERHGPGVQLNRAPGVRTIEGRIYGDPPWGRAENWSYRWLDDSTMNRTINEYVRANWETIRSDVAMSADGEFNGSYDAGHAVGEGYYNEGMTGTGPRVAHYHVTSVMQLRLRIVPGSAPPRLFIVTAFPAGIP